MISPVVIHRVVTYVRTDNIRNEELISSIEKLVELTDFIRSVGDTPFREDEIYMTEVAPGVPLYQVLYEGALNLSPELVRALAMVIDQSTSLPDDHINDNLLCAAIGLWLAPEGVTLSVKDDWYAFRRQAVIHTCKDSDELCNQIPLVFPGFIMSEEFPNCIDTLEAGLEVFLPVLIKALSSLHDELIPSLKGKTIKEGLKQFSMISGFETTMEGDAARHPALTFNFKSTDGKMFSQLCEPHMKLEHSAKPGDSTYYFNRIYFNPRQDDVAKLTIHLGHIGRHL